MSMSRRDYEAIADIFSQRLSHTYGVDSNLAIKDVMYNFANHFEQTNPRFDRDKFIAACLKES